MVLIAMAKEEHGGDVGGGTRRRRRRWAFTAAAAVGAVVALFLATAASSRSFPKLSISGLSKRPCECPVRVSHRIVRFCVPVWGQCLLMAIRF